MKRWQKISERRQSAGYRTLILKTFRLPDGEEAEFSTYSDIGSHNVAVIALTPDYRVVVARQFRPGPEIVMDELPGGSVEAGESLLEAAERELREETGYISDRLEYLGPNVREAYTNNLAHYYIAYNCRVDGPQQLDEYEVIEVAKITIRQLLDNAKRGKMTDAAAVLMAYEVLQTRAGL